MDRVFEIGRVFRNEGIDTRHNPEFTLLEAYQAFGDYHDMMDLTEALVVNAAARRAGHDRGPASGQEIDLSPPFRRASMAELIPENAGVDDAPVDARRGRAQDRRRPRRRVAGGVGLGQDHVRGLRRRPSRTS